MEVLREILITRTWFLFRPTIAWHQAYHWFNLVEGSFWFLFAAMVLARYVRHRRSLLEVWYSLAFVCFGLSDFRESYHLQSWLILAKGFNLAAIILLRRQVLRRYYPNQRAF